MPHYNLKDANFRVFLDSRQGGRKYMEDVLMIRDHKSEDGENDFVFWGVFDGHGGSEAARFAREHLLDELKKVKGFWSKDEEQVTRAIKEAFVTTHKLMWKSVGQWPKTLSGLPSTSGTTASIVLIKNGKMYVAHVGDSSVVIGEEKATWQRYIANCITKDHKPEAPEEKKRIEESGGQVMAKAGVQRVVWHRPKPSHKGPVRRSTHIDDIPFLAVARALGDLWSYNSQRNTFVVSPEPDIAVMDFNPKKHKFLVIASDGLWNMVRPDQAVALVEEMEEREPHNFNLGHNPARKLVSLALEKWAYRKMRADNTSVIVALVDEPSDDSPSHFDERRSSTSTVKLSDTDADLDLDVGDGEEIAINALSRQPHLKHSLHWNVAPSPQHIGFGQGRVLNSKHVNAVHGKTPRLNKHRHTRLKTPKSAPPKMSSFCSGKSVNMAHMHKSPSTPANYRCSPLLSSQSYHSAASGSSPVLTSAKRKAPADFQDYSAHNVSPLSSTSEPQAVKRSASDDCCPSSAKKMRHGGSPNAQVIPISGLTADEDVSQEIVISTTEEAYPDVPLCAGSDECPIKTDSPKMATSAKSPLKVDTFQASPSMAVISPIWPSCLDKDIDLDASSNDDMCALPESGTKLCSSVLRENSPKSPVTTTHVVKKMSYAKASTKFSGSQNHIARSTMIKRKAASQGTTIIAVHRLRLRSKKPIKLRNVLHRTRLQVKATVSSRRS